MTNLRKQCEEEKFSSAAVADIQKERGAVLLHWVKYEKCLEILERYAKKADEAEALILSIENGTDRIPALSDCENLYDKIQRLIRIASEKDLQGKIAELEYKLKISSNQSLEDFKMFNHNPIVSQKNEEITSLTKRLEAAEKERERLKSDRVTISGIKYAWKDGYYKAQEEITALKQRVERYEKAFLKIKDHTIHHASGGQNIVAVYCLEIANEALAENSKESKNEGENE